MSTSCPFLHYIHNGMHRDRHTDRQTGREAGMQAGRQTDRQTERQTDRGSHLTPSVSQNEAREPPYIGRSNDVT